MAQSGQQYFAIYSKRNWIWVSLVSTGANTLCAGGIRECGGQNNVLHSRALVYLGMVGPRNQSRGRPGHHNFARFGHVVRERTKKQQRQVHTVSRLASDSTAIELRNQTVGIYQGRNRKLLSGQHKAAGKT